LEGKQEEYLFPVFPDPKDLNPFLLVAQVTQIWVEENIFVGAAVKIMS